MQLATNIFVPECVCHWRISHIRRYGCVDGGKFRIDVGTRAGVQHAGILLLLKSKYNVCNLICFVKGRYEFATSESETISDMLFRAANGQLHNVGVLYLVSISKI
jgi:hypothetical protein